MKTTLNKQQKLYALDHGKYITALGFEVCKKRAIALNNELNAGMKLANAGTMKLYKQYEELVELARKKNESTGWRSSSELCPQLIGLEGKRVEVTRSSGEKERFIVGKSTGFIPCHLEIKRRDSSGGSSAWSDIKSVRVID